jgi:hypothetical protein
MDHLVLPEGAPPLIQLAYDCGEPEYYENTPDQGFEYSEFYKRVEGWDFDDVWVQPLHNEDDLGGVIEGKEDKLREPWVIDKFFQTWLFFGLIIEVFALSGIEVKTSEFLAPVVRKAKYKPQTARMITTSKLPDLIKQWRQKHQASRDETVFNRALKLLDHVGGIVDYHCAGGKPHRSIDQYGKVLWAVSDEATTAIIAVAFTLRKAAFDIYKKPGNDDRWPVTNSILLHQRIQRTWCKSDAAMIMEDFDIDGHVYFAAAKGRTLTELDRHYACTDHACKAKVADGTYITKHDPECHDPDDYDTEPKFLRHVCPGCSESPASLREAIKHTMDIYRLPVLRWDSEQKGFLTYGHQKDSYSEDSSTAPPFVAISHV